MKRRYRRASLPLLLPLLLLCGLTGCWEGDKTPTSTSSYPNKSASKRELPQLQLPTAVMGISSGKNFQVYLAVSDSEQTLGLSAIPDENWSADDGMLFWYEEDSPKSFWMPDTYFNLDIFFLDKDLKIIAVERNVPHYIGREHPETIPRTASYFCRHVLELKSSSDLAKNIQTGETLTWVSPPPWKIK